MSGSAIVFERDGRALTTSRIVAEHLEKQHFELCLDILDMKAKLEEAESGIDFRTRNFEQARYIDSNDAAIEYLITKDGFVLLSMMYTGVKAMQVRIDYINAFNKLELVLRERDRPSEHALAKAIELLTQINDKLARQVDITIG
jgi:Rha family phage regulatory protein